MSLKKAILLALPAVVLGCFSEHAWAQVDVDGGNIRIEFNNSLHSRMVANRSYRVTDYVSGKDFGTVQGPVATINGDFELYLLLEAKPE